MTSMTSRTYHGQWVWKDNTWHRQKLTSVPKVVDSYLVRDGRVVRRDLHEKRFATSVGESPVDEFLAVAPSVIPGLGDFFPRIEWHGDDIFAVTLRPAPPLRETTSLWISPDPDPRRNPAVKGPDLGMLAGLRNRAVESGCDDAVLLSKDGVVLEAANAAVVFWKDDTTVILPAQLVLPSATVAATIPLWEAAGITVEKENLTTFDLPAWCGSALHGWTPVVEWATGVGNNTQKIPAATAPSVSRWNAQLWDSAR